MCQQLVALFVELDVAVVTGGQRLGGVGSGCGGLRGCGVVASRRAYARASAKWGLRGYAMVASLARLRAVGARARVLSSFPLWPEGLQQWAFLQ